MKPTEKIWHNGKFIAWDDAKIHVLSHVVSYGSSVFEGIRCYETSSGRRFSGFASMCAACSIPPRSTAWTLPYSGDELVEAMLELVSINRFEVLLSPPDRASRLWRSGRVNGLKNPVDVYVACWEWGKYLGDEALASGIDVCISSWTRMAPNTLPALAKAGANYMNSQLIRMEAVVNGYHEGIGLDSTGNVSEGSGENIFVVRDGKIVTPPLSASVLLGITRDTVLTLAREMGIPVVER